MDPVITRLEDEPAEHFESIEQQEHAAHLGMWLFLTSETLLFGALFGLYVGYRLEYAEHFMAAARLNDATLGTINTVILVSSSFFAAWGVRAVTRGARRTAVLSLCATLGLGLAFLAIKSVEYADHIHHGILPGAHYAYAGLSHEGAKIFFTLYYFMTGLHALHVIGGLIALAVLAVLVARGRYSPSRHTPVELGVLYWHLVDVIWIFLWPLMYLAG